MAEIADRLPGEVILASYSNEIRDRAVMRYADRTARDASNPIPATGDLAYILTAGEFEIWDGTRWEVYLTDVDQTAYQARLDILENTVIFPFNATDVPFAGVGEIEMANVVLPVAGDYLIQYNCQLVAETTAGPLRYAAKMLLNLPLTQISFWEFRSPHADPDNAEYWAISATLMHEVQGAAAGDEYIVRMQATTVSSDPGYVTNRFMSAQQLPAGVI